MKYYLVKTTEWNLDHTDIEHVNYLVAGENYSEAAEFIEEGVPGLWSFEIQELENWHDLLVIDDAVYDHLKET